MLVLIREKVDMFGSVPTKYIMNLFPPSSWRDTSGFPSKPSPIKEIIICEKKYKDKYERLLEISNKICESKQFSEEKFELKNIPWYNVVFNIFKFDVLKFDIFLSIRMFYSYHATSITCSTLYFDYSYLPFFSEKDIEDLIFLTELHGNADERMLKHLKKYYKNAVVEADIKDIIE